jgi:2'-5' RNA ligase
VRLFFAFDLPRERRERLAALVPDPAPGVRRVHPDRMHVTMRYVGDVPEETRTALAEGLSGIPFGPSEARVRGVGTFPRRGAPRVLWAGIEVGGQIVRAQADLEALCRRLGLREETGPWTPHVTLGRLPGRRPPWLADFLAAHAALEFEPFDVPRIVLYDSVPGPAGTRYVPVSALRAG